MIDRRRVDYNEVAIPLTIDGEEGGQITVWRERQASTISVRIDGLPRSSFSSSLEEGSTIEVRLDLTVDKSRDIAEALYEMARA